MTVNSTLYDILIIGSGPAGMTAAIYAARAGKTVALVDAEFGGNISKSPRVENIPGFPQITGVDFIKQLQEQIEQFPNIIQVFNSGLYLEYYYRMFKLSLDDRTVLCGKSVIIATGTTHKELKFDTPDIYYCATCDGPFFKKEPVIIVGSGNSGATYALDLATYCKTVYLCDLTLEMQCEKVLQDRIKETPNIVWLPNTTINSVKNGKTGRLNSVTLTTLETIKCKAIFAAIGLVPNTTFLKNFVELDPKGYIIAPDCITTKVPGVFAAGDCRQSKVKQVVTATSDGAVAALEAIKYLDTLK